MEQSLLHNKDTNMHEGKAQQVRSTDKITLTVKEHQYLTIFRCLNKV